MPQNHTLKNGENRQFYGLYRLLQKHSETALDSHGQNQKVGRKGSTGPCISLCMNVPGRITQWPHRGNQPGGERSEEYPSHGLLNENVFKRNKVLILATGHRDPENTRQNEGSQSQMNRVGPRLQEEAHPEPGRRWRAAMGRGKGAGRDCEWVHFPAGVMKGSGIHRGRGCTIL